MTIVKIQTKNPLKVTSKRHREVNCVLFDWIQNDEIEAG